MRADIESLATRGWQLVRLRKGSKTPVAKGWPDLSPSTDEFRPGENVGVRFGPDSGGLVDVDLDFPTARHLIASPAFGLSHLVEFGRSSLPAGQRGHRLVIVPDAPNRSRVFGLRSKAARTLMQERGLGLTVVELRGSSGSQTAVPPSVIKDDALVWSGDPDDIPTMEWNELNTRVGRLAFASLAAALYPDADRNAYVMAVYGALLASGADMSAADAMVRAISVAAGDHTERDHALDHDGEGLDEFLSITGLNAISHVLSGWLGLAAADDAPEHDDRHHESGKLSAVDLERLLAVLDPHDFGAYDDYFAILASAHHATGGDKAAREVAVRWFGGNEDYGPGGRDEVGRPWPEVVRRDWDGLKLERDGKSPMHTLGSLLALVREAGHGRLVAEITRKLSEPEFDEPIEPTNWREWVSRNFVAIGVRDIAKLPKLMWVFVGVLLSGEVTLIAGKGGIGKSILSWQIAIALALGVEFGWPAPERRRRVLVLSGEDRVEEVERRVASSCQAMNVDRAELGKSGNFRVLNMRNIRLVTRTEGGKVTRTELWHAVRWAVVNENIGAVIIDPLIKSSTGFDESSNDEMELLFDHLRALVEGHDCALLVDDHFAKTGTGGDQASVRGASAKVDAARAAFTLSPMTDKEWRSLRPPRPRTAYARIDDAKVNYSRKHGARWLELVEYPVGNGETRPGFHWRSFNEMEGFIDPVTWSKREDFFRLVEGGRKSGDKKGEPWSTHERGRKDGRLDEAVKDEFHMSQALAQRLIAAFETEGSLVRTKVKTSSRNEIEVWRVNRDHTTEEDTEIEAMREMFN